MPAPPQNPTKTPLDVETAEKLKAKAEEEAQKAKAEADAAKAAANGGSSTPTAKKYSYRVFADSDVLGVIAVWLSEQDASVVIDGKETSMDELDRLAATLPLQCGPEGLDDLIHLGRYDAPTRDGAVEQMLDDEKPTDRVKLVQLVHRAQVDLTFPAIAASNLKDVPVPWEVKPTRRIGR